MTGCMISASVIFGIFAFLFLTAGDELAKNMIVSKVEIQTEIVKKTQMEMNLLAEQLQKGTDGRKNKKKLKQGKALKKKQDEAKKQLDILKKGKISALDIIPLAGYRLIQLMGWDATNDVVKKLNHKCLQFKEKKEAINYTYYLLASLLGNLILGAVLGFLVAGIGMARDMGNRSFLIGIAVFLALALLGYLPYDNVSQTVAKRQEEIERQFPQVMSKLTLLTVAGMEVSQAWKLTSVSGTGTLYEEMGRVLLDFNNNVSPVEAYSRFIDKCSNPYTTKLATAIIQNTSKGNSEIVKLFRQLNDESWLEHKHNARRMGEKIQSKLLLPTMLMFGGILILIIVPVMSGFSF